MKFVQDRLGENHHTDDNARVYFRRSATEAPTHLRCVGIGFALSAHSDAEFDVDLAPFELIGVGRFGEGRPCEGSRTTKWTGNSHKYGVYKHGRSLLILESHGGGEQGYLDRHSHAVELFAHLCATLPAERIWDICYLLAKTENRAYRKGRHEMATLFLQGRLKRKRRNNCYRLEILPGPQPAEEKSLSWRSKEEAMTTESLQNVILTLQYCLETFEQACQCGRCDPCTKGQEDITRSIHTVESLQFQQQRKTKAGGDCY